MESKTGSTALDKKRYRAITDSLSHPDVQTARTWMQEIHSVFIPAEFKLATHRRSRRVLSPGLQQRSVRNTEGTPGMEKHFSVRTEEIFKSRSPPRWVPLTAPVSASPLQTNRRVNIILPLRPGRCQCVVSHCVRTSPAAQRSQSGFFHLKPASIVIQMLVDLEPRSGACPPLL